MFKYSDEQLVDAVKKSTSVMGVMRQLGIKLTGGSHGHITRRIRRAGIDTSHFTGQGHNKGKPSPKRRKAADVLVISSNGRRAHADKLRRALLEIGRLYLCVDCGNDGTWLGRSLTLEIDHINQNWLDHRPENLRFLCPNCHDTYRSGETQTHYV